MTNRTETAAKLEAGVPLDKPVIGMAFVDEPPEGVSRVGNAAPSSCAFWREAETQVFYAAARDHYNCPLGAMVMGFELPDGTMAALMEDVGMMCENTYVREEEVPHVPKVAGKAKGGVVYGPLSQMPVEPDAALIWANPRQAMVVGESAGQIDWSSAPANVYGRPGCAAIPIALAESRPAQSFGCVGMRINSGAEDSRMLIAVPGERLEQLADALGHMSDIHSDMAAHYERRAADVSQQPPPG